MLAVLATHLHTTQQGCHNMLDSLFACLSQRHLWGSTLWSAAAAAAWSHGIHSKGEDVKVCSKSIMPLAATNNTKNITRFKEDQPACLYSKKHPSSAIPQLIANPHLQRLH